MIFIFNRSLSKKIEFLFFVPCLPVFKILFLWREGIKNLFGSAHIAA